MDYRIDAPASKAEVGLTVLASTDSDAFAAEHATVGVVVNVWMRGVNLIFSYDLGQRFGFEADFEKLGDVLQLAVMVGVAVFAVYIVDGEQHTQGRTLQAANLVCFGFDLQSRLNGDGAGCNR